MKRSLRGHILAALLGAPLLFWACGDDDDGPTDPATTGPLQVTVTADGAARSGVEVGLFEVGATSAIDTETTGSDGRATFSSLEAASYEVEITVPDGFVLDTDEDARKSATVSAGSTASISFALVDDFEGDIVEITASGTTFSDDDVTIAPGTKVRWVTSDGGHTVTPDGHSEWQEASLASSSSVFEHIFEDEGTFDYYCSPHLAMGMTGVIRVVAP